MGFGAWGVEREWWPFGSRSDPQMDVAKKWCETALVFGMYTHQQFADPLSLSRPRSRVVHGGFRIFPPSPAVHGLRFEVSVRRWGLHSASTWCVVRLAFGFRFRVRDGLRVWVQGNWLPMGLGLRVGVSGWGVENSDPRRIQGALTQMGVKGVYLGVLGV